MFDTELRQTLNILSWNIHGLKKLIDDLQFLQYLQCFDIIGLVETWSDFKGEFDHLLEHYTHFDSIRSRAHACGRNSGGISVFVKTELVKKYFIEQICCDFTDCVVL